MEQFFGMLLGLALQQTQFVGPPPYQPLPMQIDQAQPQQGGERSHLVSHNGSLMTLTVNPDSSVQIAYAQPKPELVAVGVRPGTVLVHGRWSADRRFVGTAYVFYCGALPYAVSGGVDEGGALMLEGPAPRVWARTCTVADYSWTPNSYLRFVQVPDEPYAQQK